MVAMCPDSSGYLLYKGYNPNQGTTMIFPILLTLLFIVLVILLLVRVVQNDREYRNKIEGFELGIKLLTRNLSDSREHSSALQSQIEDMSHALAHHREAHGKTIRAILTTTDTLKGRNFKSKKCLLEHSKPFKMLVKATEELKDV